MKKLLSILLAVTLLAAICTGCGASENTKTTEQPQNLTIAIDTDVDTLIPCDSQLSISNLARTAIFDRLAYMNSTTNEVEYILAKSHTVSEDGLTVTFELNQGVLFHDGTEMKASDVVFSVNTYKASTIQRATMTAVASAEAVGDYTVQFNMEYAFAPLLANLDAFVIMPEKAYTEMGADEFAKNPIGTGPFMFESRKTGVDMVLKRYDDYFRGPAEMESITFKIMTDVSARATAIEAKDVDLAIVDSVSAVTLQDVDGLSIVEAPTTKFAVIAMNLNLPIFQDVRVRQAIAYAVDRDFIVSAALDGFGTAQSILFTSSTYAYTEDVPTYSYNLEEAKRLLAEAGVEMPYDLGPLTCNAGGSTVAEILESQLSELGFKVKLQVLETSAFYGDMYGSNYTISVARLGWDPDASNYEYMLHSSNIGSTNFAQLNDPDLDAALEAARAETNEQMRLALYKDILTGLQEECIYVPLYEYPDLWCAKSGLTGNYGLNSRLDLYTFRWN